ncbi:MAG: amino acid permease, partial [Planctomycetes bacterium]|nr:amino acid permease [Planctomycetota bacterium]
MSGASDPGASPRALLRPRSAICLVVANMIGAGVFTSSGFALADHTPALVLAAWLVGGVLATCGALCYGALGRRFPHSGGEYELLRLTVHPLAGFLAGVVSLVAGFSAPIAIAAATFEIYLKTAFGIEAPAHAIGAAVIVGAALLHAIGLEVGAKAQDALVVFKLALIAVLVVAGAIALGMRGLPAAGIAALPTGFDLEAFAVTCVWVSFAYSGWNAASYLAGELADAPRTLTRSLLTGTWITAVAYLALNAVFVFAAPRAELAGQAEVGVLAARALGGEHAAMVLAALVALASLTS